MASPLHDADEPISLPHGTGQSMGKALAAFLAQRDPKGRKKAAANSSAGRAQRNAIDALPDEEILAVLVRRMRADRKRVQSRERQRRHREKLARQKILSNAHP